MKLATKKDGSRDGKLIVVSRDNKRFAETTGIAKNLQQALDEWSNVSPKLYDLYNRLNMDQKFGEPVVITDLLAPLPRAYEWVDGSAYINHIVLVRKARGADLPETLRTDPLVYQGGSSEMLAPTANIEIPDTSWGWDFESEVGVILGDTPKRVKKSDAGKYIRLLVMINDVSLRNLIPKELEKGFGFFTSKPATAFAPFAITPDELGAAWKDGRIHLPLRTILNGKVFGEPNAGPEMHFSFYDLIEHITKTRSYTAGTILGSGTVSNEDRSKGCSCLQEKRMIEKIDTGEMKTRFLEPGDTLEIEMFDSNKDRVFGKINQKAVKG